LNKNKPIVPRELAASNVDDFCILKQIHLKWINQIERKLIKNDIAIVNIKILYLHANYLF